MYRMYAVEYAGPSQQQGIRCSGQFHGQFPQSPDPSHVLYRNAAPWTPPPLAAPASLAPARKPTPQACGPTGWRWPPAANIRLR